VTMGVCREGEEEHAVCHTPRYRCGHAPVVREPEGQRSGTARSPREAVQPFLAEWRDAGEGQPSPRALAHACRTMAASVSGQLVCVPSHHL